MCFHQLSFDEKSLEVHEGNNFTPNLQLHSYGIKVSKGAKIRNRYNQVPHLFKPHRISLSLSICLCTYVTPTAALQS